MVILKYIAILLMGYMFGNIVISYIIAKIKAGIDIRQFGTNNAGASNVAVTVRGTICLDCVCCGHSQRGCSGCYCKNSF